jgi:hypothetical protein
MVVDRSLDVTESQTPERLDPPVRVASYAPVPAKQGRMRSALGWLASLVLLSPILMVVLVCALIFLLSLGFISARGGKMRDGPSSGYDRATTRNHLASICRLIPLFEETSKQPAPVTMPEFVDWLGACTKQLDVDYEGRTIRDYWGRPAVLIVRDGKLDALGSAGPNGRWEEGKGDDILARVEDVNKKRNGNGNDVPR